MHRPLTWLVTIPLAFGSAVLGHDVAQRITPIRHTVATATTAQQHPHAVWLPFLFGALATFLVVGLVVRVLETAAGSPARGGAGLGLAAVPLVVFVLAEHISPVITGNYLQLLEVSHQPAFAVGLLLQLPCGLLACLIARLLLRAAEEIGLRLRSREDDSVFSLPSRPPWAAVAVDLPRVPALALGYGERGPPELA